MFRYNKWESVKSLIFFSGRLDLHHIVNLRTLKFLIKMKQSPLTPSYTQSYLTHEYNNSSECIGLFRRYNCYKIDDVNIIKRSILNDFKDSISID